MANFIVATKLNGGQAIKTKTDGSRKIWATRVVLRGETKKTYQSGPTLPEQLPDELNRGFGCSTVQPKDVRRRTTKFGRKERDFSGRQKTKVSHPGGQSAIALWAMKINKTAIPIRTESPDGGGIPQTTSSTKK